MEIFRLIKNHSLLWQVHLPSYVSQITGSTEKQESIKSEEITIRFVNDPCELVRTEEHRAQECKTVSQQEIQHVK